MSAKIAARNIAALRAMPVISARSLEHGQEKHPDHRSASDVGKPFPCPPSAIILANPDLDFRNTGVKDLPEGMVARRTGNTSPKNRGPLGRSKWDFAYMKSGSSIAVRVMLPENDAEFNREVNRIKNIGFTMCSYQKRRGYIDPGFLVQASVENIIVGKVRGKYEVQVPHVVFWRIDGTPIDPTNVTN